MTLKHDADDTDRTVIKPAKPVKGYWSVDYPDVDACLEFMTGLTQSTHGMVLELTSALLRKVFIELDNDANMAISFASNMSDQFKWATAEADKSGAIWQFTQRAVKRKGWSRSFNVNRLKSLREELLSSPGPSGALALPAQPVLGAICDAAPKASKAGSSPDAPRKAPKASPVSKAASSLVAADPFAKEDGPKFTEFPEFPDFPSDSESDADGFGASGFAQAAKDCASGDAACAESSGDEIEITCVKVAAATKRLPATVCDLPICKKRRTVRFGSQAPDFDPTAAIQTASADAQQSIAVPLQKERKQKVKKGMKVKKGKKGKKSNKFGSE